jgi:hypothetical protein
LHALTTPQFTTSNLTRLRQEGVDTDAQERGVAVIGEQLSGGPRTRAQLRTALAGAGLPVEGQAVPHLLMRATILGMCVRGPVVDGEQAFVSVADWLPAVTPLPHDEALAQLGRRYLAGHHPADARDLAKWAGIPLGMARKALHLGALHDHSKDECEPLERSPLEAAPRLLGPFDELLMGWASRDLVLGEYAGVVTANGVFRPVILIDGRVRGVWKRSGSTALWDPIPHLSPAYADALSRERDDVHRFLTR